MAQLGSRGEIRSFLTFLQGLWGILAGLSVFFPLSDRLVRALPVRSIHDDPAGGWYYIEPGVIQVTTTLVAAFVVLWTFGQRASLVDPDAAAPVPRRAWRSLVLGILCLLLYLGLHTTLYELAYAPLGIDHGHPGAFLGDAALFVTYVGFFALLTRAFTLLGIAEYCARGRQQA